MSGIRVYQISHLHIADDQKVKVPAIILENHPSLPAGFQRIIYYLHEGVEHQRLATRGNHKITRILGDFTRDPMKFEKYVRNAMISASKSSDIEISEWPEYVRDSLNNKYVLPPHEIRVPNDLLDKVHVEQVLVASCDKWIGRVQYQGDNEQIPKNTSLLMKIQHTSSAHTAHTISMEALARKSGLHVPMTYYNSTHTEGLRELDVVIQTFVKGPTLEEAWPILTVEAKREAVGQICDMVAQLALNTSPHLEPDDLLTGFCEDEEHSEFHRYSSIEEWLHHLIDQGCHEGDKAQLHVLAKGPFKEMPNVLCHNDLEPRNVILHATQGPILIDWGNAAFEPLSASLAAPYHAIGLGRNNLEWHRMLQDGFDRANEHRDHRLEYIIAKIGASNAQQHHNHRHMGPLVETARSSLPSEYLLIHPGC